MARGHRRSVPFALAVALVAAGAAFVGSAAPASGDATRLAVDGEPVVWLPGGWFVRGADEPALRQALILCQHGSQPPLPDVCFPQLFDDEQPRDRVWVSAYGIDREEVTHAEWRRCVAAGACPPSRLGANDERVAKPDHPVAGISWREARGYCRHVGGRLPTEAEWERAARGADGRRFPWGEQWSEGLANHGRSGERLDDGDGHRWAAPVGSYPAAKSPHGLLDAAGNVWEWTADRYGPDAYRTGSTVDPKGAESGGQRAVRGGSWLTAPHTLRATHRDHRLETGAWPDVGLRCVYER